MSVRGPVLVQPVTTIEEKQFVGEAVNAELKLILASGECGENS